MADGSPRDNKPGVPPDPFEERLRRIEETLRGIILDLMKTRRISRANLARKLGVSRPAITQLLNQGSNLTLRRLLGIAEALDCHLDIRLREGPTRPQPPENGG